MKPGRAMSEQASSRGLSSLEALNKAFLCAYIECPGYVIDDLRARFNAYLVDALAEAQSSPRAGSEALRALIAQWQREAESMPNAHGAIITRKIRELESALASSTHSQPIDCDCLPDWLAHGVHQYGCKSSRQPFKAAEGMLPLPLEVVNELVHMTCEVEFSPANLSALTGALNDWLITRRQPASAKPEVK